jgi:hypothetical protein
MIATAVSGDWHVFVTVTDESIFIQENSNVALNIPVNDFFQKQLIYFLPTLKCRI